MAKALQKIELNVQNRQILGTGVRKLRRDGYIPAVLYGKGQEAISLQVPIKEFSKVLKTAGESTLIYVNVNEKTYPTIIHDVARDPLTDDVLHADFYKVRLDEKIKTKVPVVFTGEAPAVKDLAGIFVRNVNELEVEAFPQDLPHEIIIDVSSLKNFGDQILVKDINLGTNVKVQADNETLVATVQEPMSEEELKASLEAPVVGVEEVEVIKKEKPEEIAEAAEGEVRQGREAPAETPAPQEK